VDLAGPAPVDLVDLVRCTFEAKGDPVEVVPTFEGMPFGPDLPPDAFLAPDGARIAPTTLDEWLAEVRSARHG
jgi:hypothetical protein